MIIDLQKFIEKEKGCWEELEQVLDKRARDPYCQLDMEDIKRFHYLYQRVSSDLARIATFAAEQETRKYLATLVARAYAEIHETRRKPHNFGPWKWFIGSLPRAFRRNIKAFNISLTITLVGCMFGSMVVIMDPGAKKIILPFQHLLGSPSERVDEEEERDADYMKGRKSYGAAWYMTHNTKVSITVMALGVTWGVGSIILLFYNGVILGAVVADYVAAGEAKFLVAWLLPHGSVEIPAIIIAGQVALMLASAIIGWGTSVPLRLRLRRISGDVVTLMFGVAILLVWAGIIESFLSQYHEPTIPYSWKIALGCVEFSLLVGFLGWAGRKKRKAAKNE